MNRCKDCKFFDRSVWHDDGEFQRGGRCRVLAGVLGLDNSGLHFIPSLYVQDEFGCVLWKPKLEAKGEA